jgi:hypothetical protein
MTDPGPETQPSLEAHPDPLEPLVAEPSTAQSPAERNGATRDGVAPAHTAAEQAAPEAAVATPPEAPPSEPLPVPAQPVVVPGQYQFLKRWTFVLVLIGVWIPAAVIGLGLYQWWYSSIDKTPPVFVLLMYLVVCTVGALLLAMAQNKPLVSGVALALMSAPFASTAAAAALYGGYVFHWIQR